MTNQPTPAADVLVADARRAVHESLVFLAAPEADRVRALIADLETAVEGRTAMRAAAPVPSAPTTDPTVLRERIADILADADGCRWVPDFDRHRSPAYQAYLERADKVLAALSEVPVPTGDQAASPLRDDVLRALDFPLCQTLGYTTPEGLLAAYDTTLRAAAEELLPSWEAMYEPGNVSDYLIGYTNDEAPAKAAAEAWLRSQKDDVGLLEWTPWGTATPLPDGYDQWFELTEDHGDGMPTGPGIVVRRRLAAGAQQGPSDEDVVEAHRTALSFAVSDDAGAQQQPTTETPSPDTCRSVDVDGAPVLVRGSGDFTEQDARFFGEVVRAAKRKYETEHGPAADEDAVRAARHDSLHTLLARLDRVLVLTRAETGLLRDHIEAEIREHDTMRAVAAGNKRHVQTIVPEIDRLTDDLERAQAAIERVRALASRWAVLRTHGSAATELRAALDGTEQPTEAS